MSVRGLISIGTNSTRALVADLGGKAPVTLLHRSVGTRIGEGLRERGHLDETAMRRTLDAVAEHAAAIREQTDDVRAIATSALRRADNEQAFAERVRALTGACLEIISGEEEAACSFTGALNGIEADAHERFGVLDVGGGSSEYAVGTKSGPQHAVSYEIGAVRLTEAFPQLAGTGGSVSSESLERSHHYVERVLGPAAALQHVDRLVLVGGSATTAVSLVRGRRELFEYAVLSANELEAWIECLASTPLQERRNLPGMNPQRADILLGGLLILRCFLTIARHERADVSAGDVLLGYLLRHADER